MQDPQVEQTSSQFTAPAPDERVSECVPATVDGVPGKEAHPGEVTGVVLPLIVQLREALREQAVVYCQWKGHWKCHRWATGAGDIDLLVSRAHVQRCTSILCQLGFKPVLGPPDLRLPGMSSYYGFD